MNSVASPSITPGPSPRASPSLKPGIGANTSSTTSAANTMSTGSGPSSPTRPTPTPAKRLRPKLSIGTDGLRPSAKSKNITLITDPSPVSPVIVNPPPNPVPTSVSISNSTSGPSPNSYSYSKSTGPSLNYTPDTTYTQPRSHQSSSRRSPISKPKPNSSSPSSSSGSSSSSPMGELLSNGRLSASSKANLESGQTSGSDTDDIAGDESEDDILKNFERLERLRRDVANNLRLRPLRQQLHLKDNSVGSIEEDIIISNPNVTSIGMDASSSTDTIKDSRIGLNSARNYNNYSKHNDNETINEEEDDYWSPYYSALSSSEMSALTIANSAHRPSYPSLQLQTNNRVQDFRSKSVPESDLDLDLASPTLSKEEAKKLIEKNTREGTDARDIIGKEVYIESPEPSPAISVYYTPTTELRSSPLSAVYVGKFGEDQSSSIDGSRDGDKNNVVRSLIGAGSDSRIDVEMTGKGENTDTFLAGAPISKPGREKPRNPFIKQTSAQPSPPVASQGQSTEDAATASSTSSIGAGVRTHRHPSRGMSIDELVARLDSGLAHPLVIDTRPCGEYLACRIRGSVNIAIPSLILRRSLHTKSGTASGSGVGAPSGLMSLEGLKAYVTTEAGRRVWEDMVGSGLEAGPGVKWDGTVVVCDEGMEEDEMEGRSVPTLPICWAVYALLERVVKCHLESHQGHSHREDLPETVAVRAVRFLKGGIAAVRLDSSADRLLRAGEEQERRSEEDGNLHRHLNNTGLFQIDTLASRSSHSSLASSKLPVSTASSSDSSSEDSASSSSVPSLSSAQPSPNTLRLPPTTNSPSVPNSSSSNKMLCDMSPSPSPSALAFPPLFSKTRKGSIPNLRRIDTSSAERLVPKLTVRTVPIKSHTLAAPSAYPPPAASISRHSSASSLRSTHSPPRLNLNLVPPESHNAAGSSHSQLTSNKNGLTPPSSNNNSTECLLSPSVHHPSSSSLFYSSSNVPRTPTTPVGFNFASNSNGVYGAMPPTPSTARPEYDQPPSTEEDPLPVFSISTILPNFLYLGPEPSSPEHVDELMALGVKRILNIAIECDDDLGLGLRERFEKYTRIPMRDTVEEENVARSVREACDALDDARLHSAPTYVHCKAGKSRSVTAVIAYLIHANHWRLARAYAFVTERRKGVSPNIGFVSELMTFEEMELGGKSVGVVGDSSGGNSGKGASGYAGPASAVEGPSGVDSRQALYNVHQHYGGGYGYGYNGYNPSVRRATKANMRESLPPMISSSSTVITSSSGGEEDDEMYGESDSTFSESDAPSSKMNVNGPASMASIPPAPASARPGLRLEERERVGDSAQEVEVKDASGRYRHARRAPVDEYTLQPMRRVSKAGLESSEWSLGPGASADR